VSTHRKYTREHIEAREKMLNAAVTAGKFPTSRRKHYSDLYDADPEGTARAVGQLAAGLADPKAIVAQAELDKLPAYNSRWLNAQEQRRIAVAQAGGRPPQIEFGA